jgi:hypothetical protein
MARASMADNNEDSEAINEEKQKLKLQLDVNFKVLEEAEYMDDVIDERQKDIDKIGQIMGDVREIAKDFALEVNMQGDKVLELESKNEATAVNTVEATKQLKQANERSKKNG